MENKTHETEEELKARLKEELKAELLKEIKEEEAKKNKKSTPPVFEPSMSTVKFDSYNDRGIKEVVELNSRDKKFGKNDEPKMMKGLPQAPESDTGKVNLVLIIAILCLVIGSYFAIPKIYVALSTEKEDPTKTPETEKPEQPIVELEDITLQSDVIGTLIYPIMRNNPYTTKSYYNTSSITVNDISNNDLLYNAFIQIYKGNIGNYTGAYNGTQCVTDGNRKAFNAKYIDARMDNIFTKSVEFKHESFKVPSTNKDTQYVGVWKYDKVNHQYIYYGDCSPISPAKVMYYDLSIAYDAKGVEKNTVIEVYHHVAFAKVNTSTKQYEIYADAGMKNKILSGTITTTDAKSEVETAFSAYIIDGNEAGKYKYTFSNNDCSYQDYCFEKGEFVEGV